MSDLNPKTSDNLYAWHNTTDMAILAAQFSLETRKAIQLTQTKYDNAASRNFAALNEEQGFSYNPASK